MGTMFTKTQKETIELTVMKEHNMKRIVVLLATLLLSFGLVYGANNIEEVIKFFEFITWKQMEFNC